MAVREILIYPQNENALRKQSKPVRKTDRNVKLLIKDLIDTLNTHHEKPAFPESYKTLSFLC